MTSRILVIDDESDVRLSVHGVLARAGHEVATAGSALEALTILGQACFDLLLVDYRLPDAFALDVLRRGRTICPETEVIVMTAAAEVSLAADAIKRAAYDILPKPFSRRDLERVVGHALERQALVRENRRLRSQLGAVADVVGTGPGSDAEGGVGMIQVPIGTPLEAVERLLIDETLRRTGGNKQRAASLLGIAARTIYRKLASN